MSSNDSGYDEDARRKRILEGVAVLIILGVSIGVAAWVGRAMTATSVNAWHVLLVGALTAIATAYGAFPFLFFDELGEGLLGMGNAIAAGLMLGASIGLLVEGATVEDVGRPILRLLIGLIVGGALVFVTRRWLSDRDGSAMIGQAQEAGGVQMLMIVGIMTAHSFAEGIGVGVSFGDGQTLGALISIAIAIHNIPEGLAISLILIPRGTSVLRAALWSMFSSLPQPLMAVPAFLFVQAFRPLLPLGLGLAAGAMFWMTFRELLPEALEDSAPRVVYPATIAAMLAMLVFQFLIL